MAVSDVVAPRQTAQVSNAKQAVIEAVMMLNFNEPSPSAEEITRRVTAARDLLQGISIPNVERRELDRLLMQIAFREPNTTDEVRTLIRLIFKGLRPGGNLPSTQRDEYGRLMPITDSDEPVRLMENELLSENTAALEQNEC